MSSVSFLSVEDRRIVHHLRFRPSTQSELELEFPDGTKTMRGRLIRLERNKLIFSAKIVMPKARLPKINPTNNPSRKVYFATPNPHVDLYSKQSTSTLMRLLKSAAQELDSKGVEADAHLLVQLDTLLTVVYTRYIFENVRERESDA